jgi:glycosyltransferase involved in cell wall biosynthesis
MRKLESRALSRANAIIVHSRFMRKDLLSNYGPDLDSKVNVLPLCVDVDRYHPALDMAVTRRILGIPIDRPTILTVRRLVARTGIENLLSAVALVRQQIPNVLLLVAGSGYLRQQLSDYISGRGLDGNVILLGHVPELDLPLYYQSADVFILPTVAYEGFGLSTIEALASGTPVLATRVGATPELLEPLGADFLLPGQGAEHMAAGILRWLGRKGEVSVREKCRAYCVDHFAVDTVCSALNGLLHEIAAT